MRQPCLPVYRVSGLALVSRLPLEAGALPRGLMRGLLSWVFSSAGCSFAAPGELFGWVWISLGATRTG